MSGERAVTARRRIAGEICCRCQIPLPPPTGERYCNGCSPCRRIYMSFHLQKQWIVGFKEPDLKATAGRMRRFETSDKILALAERGGALKCLADRQALEAAIQKGSGGLWLLLTEDQYNRIR